MLRSFSYAAKQAFIQVFRNRAMSIASMFSITAMLLILGLFFILIVNINMVSETAKKQFDTIQIYLQDETAYDQAVVIIDDLTKLKGVKEASYLSREQAMAQWKAKWGDHSYLLDGLENNPLPNSILIKVSKLEEADSIVSKAKTFNGIEDIKYYKDTVDQLMKITRFIQIGAMGYYSVFSDRICSSRIEYRKTHGNGKRTGNQYHEVYRCDKLVYSRTIFDRRNDHWHIVRPCFCWYHKLCLL